MKTAQPGDLATGRIRIRRDDTGGPAAALSDADWIAQARRHIEALGTSGMRFDRVLLETWDKYPAHTFSESDPADTLAGLVADYSGARAQR